MRNAGWRRTFLRLGAVLSFVGMSHFVGCALSRTGTKEQDCTDTSNCDDGNPCTTELCAADGVCVVEALPDGVVAQQVAYNCSRTECRGGQLVEEDDPADLPLDDGNDCTIEACSDGPQVSNADDGAPCESGLGSGVCVDGECAVECTSENESVVCNDMLPCTTDVCDANTGQCAHVDLNGVLSPEQSNGDCQTVLCNDGVEDSLNDNLDLPVDGIECTQDICTEGVPSNPPEPTGTSCDQDGGRVCDGDGACVACNEPSDCVDLPVDDDCQKRSCTEQNTCVPVHTAADTPVNQTLQSSGNCKLLVCDGLGGMKNNVDGSDLPDDQNDCTQDLCDAMGNPSNPDEDLNTPCGVNDALFCDGDGVCADCTEAAQCGTDTFCLSFTCMGGNCGSNDENEGVDLPSMAQTDNNCQVLRCDSGMAQSFADNDDLPVPDAFECTKDECQNGAEAHPPEPMNTLCSGGTEYCDGNGACVECNLDGQCSGAADCEFDDCDAKVCTIKDENAGTPAPNGQTAGDCKVIVCDGDGNVDPTRAVQEADKPIDGNECTKDLCDMLGNASNPEEPAETECNNATQVCNGDSADPLCVDCATNSQCAATEACDMVDWTCKKIDGETCDPGNNGDDCISGECVDDVCCENACGGTCAECNAMGNCVDVGNGNQDPGTCDMAGYECDGAGACLKPDGAACDPMDNGDDCISSECVDDVCCENACAGTCKICNGSGSCANVPAYSQDPGTCDTAGFACDAAQQCQKRQRHCLR